MKVTFEYDKETKNNIRFTEVESESSTDTPVMRVVYVHKNALNELGYSRDNPIVVDLRVRRDD